MNNSNRIWFGRAVLWLAVSVLLGGSSLRLAAGDAIIFGKEKAKVDPIKGVTPGKESSKSWEALSEAAPFHSVAPSILPPKTSQDPKKDKRRKAELEEKKNWMIYERGELQDKAEEEEQFGVREYNLEGSDDDGRIRDLTFKDMGRKGQSRTTGRTSSRQRKENGNQDAQQQRERELAEAEADETRQKLDLRGTGQTPAGAISAGLDMKTILDAGKVREEAKPPISLSDSLKSGAAPALTREQQARREEFKSFLNGASSPNALAGPSDPINQRIDFTRTVNPVFPKTAEPILKSGGANPYANPYNLPADAYSPRTPGFLPSPFLADPPRPVNSSFGAEAPKRTGFGTLGGHPK